jgi:hypothetical protein
MYKISIKKIILAISLLYACTTVFTPKINLGIAPVYLFEPIFLLVVIYLFLSNKISIETNIEKTYILFCIISALTYFEGPLYTDTYDIKPIAICIKFSIFIFLLPVARYLNGAISERLFLRIIYSQFLFIFITSIYVVFNMIQNPISLGDMIWGYSAQYRLIGLTGQSFGMDGLTHIGNTSVQMGVYTGLLFLICLSLYINFNKSIYIIFLMIIFLGSLLTYSRSGLVVIALGLMYFIFDNLRNRKVIQLLIVVLVAFFSLSIFIDLSGFITSFGSFGKLVETSGYEDGSAQQRVAYVMSALDYMSAHPYAIFFGTGYGDSFTMSLIGTPHLESLILTTIFQSGIFALFILISHFYYLWRYSNHYSKKINKNIYRAVLYGYKLYIPGLVLANLVGGNSLQTDFIAPFFYLVLGICLYRLRDSNKKGI